LHITAGLKAHIRDKRILLVDDIADSGRTLKRAIGYLKRFRPKTIATVTMFYKPRSAFKPDYFAEQTDKWVIFPHEHTETILLLTKAMKNQKKSDDEIQTFLRSLNLADTHLAFVKRYYHR